MDQIEYSLEGEPVHRDQFIDAISADGDDVEYVINGEPASREYFEAVVREIHRRAEPLLEIGDPRGQFLRGRAANVTSQFGEDGLIAATLERIGIRNRWCFEVGAGDGVELSNTKVLRNAGWFAVLIEADAAKYSRLFFQVGYGVSAVHERIGPDSLDRILSERAAPLDIDVGVIDIDGQDYHIFDGLRRYRPRVLLVEYNQVNAPAPPLDGEGQAGLTAIVALGRAKGYVPLARTNVNVLFVAQEDL